MSDGPASPGEVTDLLDETAEVIGVHPDTVNCDWQLAKAFLRRELERP